MGESLGNLQSSLWKVRLGKGDVCCSALSFLHWFSLCMGILKEGKVATAALRSGSQAHVYENKLKAAQTSLILASPSFQAFVYITTMLHVWHLFLYLALKRTIGLIQYCRVLWRKKKCISLRNLYLNLAIRVDWENAVNFRNKDMAVKRRGESCPVPIVGGLQWQEEMWVEQMSWDTSLQWEKWGIVRRARRSCLEKQ